jgi:hypothetical protein
MVSRLRDPKRCEIRGLKFVWFRARRLKLENKNKKSHGFAPARPQTLRDQGAKIRMVSGSPAQIGKQKSEIAWFRACETPNAARSGG